MKLDTSPYIIIKVLLLSFAHEIAHSPGAAHNKEKAKDMSTSYGYGHIFGVKFKFFLSFN